MTYLRLCRKRDTDDGDGESGYREPSRRYGGAGPRKDGGRRKRGQCQQSDHLRDEHARTLIDRADCARGGSLPQWEFDRASLIGRITG